MDFRLNIPAGSCNVGHWLQWYPNKLVFQVIISLFLVLIFIYRDLFDLSLGSIPPPLQFIVKYLSNSLKQVSVKLILG